MPTSRAAATTPGPGGAEDAQTRPRAAPLSAPARRAAIVAATVPLLRRHGMSVTTRQIAEAAGVAEGTIFSVFADKETLLGEALQAAFDPEPTRVRLTAIDPNLELEDRLVVAVEIVQGHLAGMWQLLSAVGPESLAKVGGPGDHNLNGHAPNGNGPNGNGPNGTANGHGPRGHKLEGAFGSKELADLFEADRDGLSLDPTAASQALIGLTLAGTHPAVVGGSPRSAAEIVSLLLHGILARPASPARAPSPDPTGVRP
jgi:AcrR family transcriptional regulator